MSIDGVSLLNKDSIILISSKHNFARLLNTKGDTLKKFVLDTTVQANFFANPIATTYTPAYRDKDWILINGFLGPKINIEKPLNEDVENLCLKINLKTGEQIAVMSYPDAYQGKMWSPNMLFFYRTFNEDKKEFVYSFPADHNVTITDFKNRSKSMLASSKYFEKIKPFSKDQMAYAEREAYFYNTPSYGPIIYDKFQNLYFRIAHQQISEEDRQSKDINRSTIKHVSIIILDEHFNRVGETLLPRFSFTETMFFVTENGLHFGKWEKSKLDEDFLVFGIFKARNK